MSLTTQLLPILKIAKDLPLEEVTELLKVALSKCWQRQSREYLVTLLDFAALGDELSEADTRHIQDLAERFLGEPLATAATRPVITATTDAYALGKRSVALDFALTAPDLGALSAMRRYSLYWVGKTFDRFVAQDIERAVMGFFRSGATRSQLAEGLEMLLRGRQTPKVEGYFGLLADHLTTKLAEMGRISGYEEAGVEMVEIVARLDARTTPICRALHGRTIPVSVLSGQRDRMVEAAASGDMEAVKAAQPMVSGAREIALASLTRTSDITAQGVGMPPYHFRCRTVTVAHFPPASYPERVAQWAIDGEVPHKELSGLVDAARSAHWGTHQAVWQRRHGGDGKEHSTFFVHAQTHGISAGMTAAGYNQKAFDLIRRPDRDAWLVIVEKEHPYPVLYFHDPKTEEFAIVNLSGSQIASYYKSRAKRFQQKLDKAEIALELPMRGVMKWMRRFFR